MIQKPSTAWLTLCNIHMSEGGFFVHRAINAQSFFCSRLIYYPFDYAHKAFDEPFDQFALRNGGADIVPSVHIIATYHLLVAKRLFLIH